MAGVAGIRWFLGLVCLCACARTTVGAAGLAKASGVTAREFLAGRRFECDSALARCASPVSDQIEVEGTFFPLRLRGGSAPAVANFEEVGAAFVQHYYNIFDTNRAGLQSLYQDVSMLTFEGEKHQGTQSIAQKLASLPFTSVKHEVITVDSQPTASGGVMVFVCGNLKVDGSDNPMKFSQVFSLQPLPSGQGYFCYNDVFRLNYG